ncbi:MAG: nuclear transport factor 2 family protein [Haloarculaceae archaeon]
MDAAATIREYYDALRSGAALGPFFADPGADAEQSVVKFGISERLVGPEAIEAGLREQTETTTDWTVDSRALRVTERDGYAWFSDDVALGWTDTDRRIRFEFDTRWSGTLEARDDGGRPAADGEWRFVGMHVSTAGEV